MTLSVVPFIMCIFNVEKLVVAFLLGGGYNKSIIYGLCGILPVKDPPKRIK